jgi:hypothetical protein
MALQIGFVVVGWPASADWGDKSPPIIIIMPIFFSVYDH